MNEVSQGHEATGAPFSRHDTRNKAPENRPASDLEIIRMRIDRIGTEAFQALNDIAISLSNHADRVYGEKPPQHGVGEDTAQPVYGAGQLGEIFRSLDMMESGLQEVVSRVSAEAARNSALA